MAAAQASLGRALHTFLTSNDDPSVNGYSDANFLAARLAGYVAAVQAAVDAGAQVVGQKGMLVNKVVIPHPRGELLNEMV